MYDARALIFVGGEGPNLSRKPRPWKQRSVSKSLLKRLEQLVKKTTFPVRASHAFHEKGVAYRLGD